MHLRSLPRARICTCRATSPRDEVYRLHQRRMEVEKRKQKAVEEAARITMAQGLTSEASAMAWGAVDELTTYSSELCLRMLDLTLGGDSVTEEGGQDERDCDPVL